jgi:O-acetyl-ADP-ribose deacetylase (regulator of RNase III)
MQSIKGDIIELFNDGVFDILIHGCNCFNIMGSGVAKSIKDRYPEAYNADLKTKKGDKSKLGSITVAPIINQDKTQYIVNAYTQYNYGRDKCYVDYDAVRSCFYNINMLYSDPSIKFGYPKIGAGLAGGNWDIISNIIDEELKDRDHILVEYYSGI